MNSKNTNANKAVDVRHENIPIQMDEFPRNVSLLKGIVMGGPIFMALHVLMLLSFVLSIYFSTRRKSGIPPFGLSLFPFVIGAFAMWVGVLGFSAIVPSFFSGLYDRDPLLLLHLLQRPFCIGIGLSTAALVMYLFFCGFHSKTKNA